MRLSEKERGMRANKGSASTDGAKSFVSFSEVASTPSSALSSYTTQNTQAASLSTNLSPIYLGDDINLSVITKKLTKKNPVSRLKALQELKAVLQVRLMCSDLRQDLDRNTQCKKCFTLSIIEIFVHFYEHLQDRGNAVIPDLAPFFVFIYNRLVLENQTNIREESNVVLEMLMQIDKKSFAGHMKVSQTHATVTLHSLSSHI